MALIGLTGGIGSGKSLAAKRFAAQGIPVVDADHVGHEVIAPGGPGVQPVIEEFGDAILTDGAIDREKLGALVFNDEEKRRYLNGVVHPIIQRRVAEECAQQFQSGARHVIIEAALLAENGKPDPMFDKFILVECPSEIRIARLAEHRGMSRDEAESRIAAQTPPENKRDFADWIIDNRGTIEALHEQVDSIVGVLNSQ